MRILFDHSTPAPLRHSLPDHTVETAAERGWERLSNSKLLEAAEDAGFALLLTADQGFQHQQNLRDRRIAVLILSRGNWPDVQASIPRILDGIKGAKVGACIVVECLTSSPDTIVP